MQINDLRPARGSNKERKRLGRGTGTGQGTSGGKGTKGQKARKSGHVRQGFEGGQMPLLRRIPKRGFNNTQFATVYEIVNVGDIADRYETGETVNAETLKARGLAHANKDGIKILGDGDIAKKLIFEVDKVSKTALEKLQQAGCEVNIKEVKKRIIKKKEVKSNKAQA